jgi:hypothetical protein
LESETDKVYRHTLPEQRGRFALWVLGAFGINYAHAAVRPWIIRAIPTSFLKLLYLRIATTLIVTLTVISLGALVTAYYFALRDRRVHTAMSEIGLAARSIIAGVFALGAFVLALFVNDGAFLPK